MEHLLQINQHHSKHDYMLESSHNLIKEILKWNA